MPFAPPFAAHAAFAEKVNAARYYVAIAPQRKNQRSGAAAPVGFSSILTTFFRVSSRKKV